MSKEHNEGYLTQLLTYVQYKAKQSEIVSIKKYIFGILKKKPTMKELLTPNCIIQAKKDKYEIQNLQEKKALLEQQDKQANEAKNMKMEIESYIEQLTTEKRKNIEEAYNASIFASGLKFGNEMVDLQKPVVKASFYRFVYTKFIK